MAVTEHAAGNCACTQDPVLQILGQAEPFHQLDRSHVVRIGKPTPNPLDPVRPS